MKEEYNIEEYVPNMHLLEVDPLTLNALYFD